MQQRKRAKLEESIGRGMQEGKEVLARDRLKDIQQIGEIKLTTSFQEESGKEDKERTKWKLKKKQKEKEEHERKKFMDAERYKPEKRKKRKGR